MEITMKQAKDSTVKQRIQDIQMMVSWREIAHAYFGKSASWLYHKLDGIINASLMRQYAMGKHEPSQKRKQQILECLHQIAKELQTAVI